MACDSKRVLSLLCLCMLLVLPTSGKKMRDVFASMPDDVLEVMTKNNRLDCIDFIENNMEAKVRNRFDGYSVLQYMNDDYLRLLLTSNVQVEMKLLPVNDSIHYICMVKTYGERMKESTMVIYTPEWERLPIENVFTAPAYNDYWKHDEKVSMDELKRLQSLQDMHFITMKLHPDTLRLDCTLQVGEVIDEERERVGEMLQPISFYWKDRHFTK